MLRERIVAAVKGGMSVKETARVFSVNVMTVFSYLKRLCCLNWFDGRLRAGAA